VPNVPEGHIVHSTPHRLRVRIPAKRHDRHFFSSTREYFSRQPTVEAVKVNPLTASVLIHASDARSLVESLGRDGPFILVELSETAERNALEQVREQLSQWDAQLQRWTGSRHDARVYVFFVLVLSAAYQLVKGEIFAPAATLLWYSAEALRLWVPSDKARDSQPSGPGEANDAV
jgi:Heavy metal associated domain 2